VNTILLAMIFAVLCLTSYGVFRVVWALEDLATPQDDIRGPAEPAVVLHPSGKDPLTSYIDEMESVTAYRARNGHHP
jgi:hypothetical protein